MKLSHNSLLMLTAACGLLLLTACGGGDKDDDHAHAHSPDGAHNSVHGRVVKGALANATVELYMMPGDVPADEPFVTTSTDEDGYFDVELADDFSGPIVFKTVTTENTRMRCDSDLGCIDRNSLQKVEFGEHFYPGEDFSLLGMIADKQAGKREMVNLNAFTEMALLLAVFRGQNNQQDFSPILMYQAIAEVSDLLRDHDMLAVNDFVHSVELIDITNEAELTEALDNERSSAIALSFLSAGLQRFAMKQGFSAETAKTLIQIDYLANNGEFFYTAFGDSNRFTMLQLFTHARDELAAQRLKKDHSALASLDSRLGLQLLKIANKQPEETTQSDFPQSLAEFFLGDQAIAQHTADAFRTLGYTVEETIKQVSTDLLRGVGGEINLNPQKPDDIPMIRVARQAYPSMGAVMSAMVNVANMPAEERPTTYDLAVDPDNLLADDLKVSGVMQISNTGSNTIRFSLQNGELTELGAFDFEFNIRGYSWSSIQYASYDIKLHLPEGELSLSDHYANIYSSTHYYYPYYQTQYRPYQIRSEYADVAFVPANETAAMTYTRFAGKTDFTLYWGSRDYSRLPLVEAVSFSGYTTTDWNSDVPLLELAVRYTNTSWYSSQPYDLKDVVNRQTDAFILALSVDATVRMPDSNYPRYGRYTQTNLELGLSRSQSGDEKRWIEMKSDGDGYRLETFSGDRPRFVLFTHLGSMLEAVQNNDTINWGRILSGNRQVASISASAIGPIIRYQDGTMESF